MIIFGNTLSYCIIMLNCLPACNLPANYLYKLPLLFSSFISATFFFYPFQGLCQYNAQLTLQWQWRYQAALSSRDKLSCCTGKTGEKMENRNSKTGCERKPGSVDDERNGVNVWKNVFLWSKSGKPWLRGIKLSQLFFILFFFYVATISCGSWVHFHPVD